MERTRTVKRGYVVLVKALPSVGESSFPGATGLSEQERPDAVFAWPLLRRDLPDGQWSFYSAGKSGACDLDARQDLLKLETGFTFYHEFLLLHARHIAGGGQCGVFRTFHPSLRVARNPEAGAPSAGSV